MCSFDWLKLKDAIMREGLPLYYWPNGEFTYNLSSRKDRQLLIWQAFFISVPIQHQKDVWSLLSNYWADQEKLIAWMLANRNLTAEERDKLSPYTQEALRSLDAVVAAHPDNLERSVKLIVKNLPGDRLVNIIECLDDPSKVYIQKKRGLNAKNKKLGIVAPEAVSVPVPTFN
jgi:hypothetical protein